MKDVFFFKFMNAIPAINEIEYGSDFANILHK